MGLTYASHKQLLPKHAEPVQLLDPWVHESNIACAAKHYNYYSWFTISAYYTQISLADKQYIYTCTHSRKDANVPPIIGTHTCTCLFTYIRLYTYHSVGHIVAQMWSTVQYHSTTRHSQA